MIGILLVSHEPLGTALLNCTRHIFGRLPVQLAPAEHLAMRARQDFRAETRRRVGCRAAHGDVLVRDQECADSATEMVDATLHQLREVVRRIAAL